MVARIRRRDLEHPAQPQGGLREFRTGRLQSGFLSMPYSLCVDELTSPLGFLRQALWLRAWRRHDGDPRAERLWIWLETLSGQVVVLSLFDPAASMADLLPALSVALRVTTKDWPCLQSILRDQWLIAPGHHGGFLADAPLEPGRELLREAMAWADGTERSSHDTELESLRERLGRITGAFLQRLDPLILRHLGRLEPRRPGVADYNRYAAWPQPQRRYRLQALWSFPWLETLWASDESPEEGNRQDEVLSAVDQARKLLPAIEAHFGVRPAAIRHLRQVRQLIGGRPERAQALAWALDARGPQCRDLGDDQDLDALLDVLEAFHWLGDRELVRCLARDLDFGEARRLVGQLVYIDYPFPEGCEDEERTLVALFGMFAALPFATVQERGLTALRDLLVGEGVERTMFIVRTLVEGLVEEFYALPRNSGVGVSWPAISPGQIQVGDLIATELLSTEDLQREGDAMQHCVGGYWMVCEVGESHIFSVCHVDGHHVSTIEFTIRQGVLVCRQHQGWRNAPPSPEALIMERRLREVLQTAMDQQPRAPERCAPTGR